MKRHIALTVLLVSVCFLPCQASTLAFSGRLHSLMIVPLWAIYTAIVGLVILSIHAGFMLAAYRIRKGASDAQPPISTGVGALMGLLAFMLAFTFGLTIARFETRKALLLEEVNAIEATYMRTAMIPEPHRTAIRENLKAYVGLRIEFNRNPQFVSQLISESNRLCAEMWKHVEQMANGDPKAVPFLVLFANAFNDLNNLKNKRVTVGSIYNLPDAIWVVLFLLTSMAMIGMGYLFGMSAKTNWPLFLIISLAYAAIIILIIDLDSGGGRKSGFIKVSHLPVIQLQERMNQ